MKLFEIQKQPQMLTDRKAIAKWLKSRGVKKFEIQKNLTVNVYGDVDLDEDTMEDRYNKLKQLKLPFDQETIRTKHLPVQFHRVTGMFSMTSAQLESGRGLPIYVGAICYLGFNKLKSLRFLPEQVGGSLYLHDNQIRSLHKIDKRVKRIGREFTCTYPVTNVLGLLLINNLQEVRLIADNVSGDRENAERVSDIINNHLRKERDIFACQDDLIEAGFPDQAKL